MVLVASQSSAHSRLSPVAQLKKNWPYRNYLTNQSISHSQPKTQTKSAWTGPRGFGQKHILDTAPFSLWDTENHDFRHATPLEQQWIISQFKATAIGFQFPVLVIVTSDPPSPLPLTVASVAVVFIPPRQPVDDSLEARLIPDVRPLSVTTNYAGPRRPTDPLDFTFPKWTEPTEPQITALLAALVVFCNPRQIHILCPYLIIELHVNDERVYKPDSLPRRIGGFAVYYHHSQESVFGGLSVQGRERLIVPSESVQDTTDYMQTHNILCPGIRVESAQATDVGPYAEIAISTTAGVLLRDTHGHERITVCNHGFTHSSEVFHPSNSGTQIGEIEERWEALDVALVKLNPSISFTNQMYFESKVPRRLLRSNEIPLGTFFCVDGMSTGAIFLQVQGISLYIPNRPADVSGIEHSSMKIYRIFGSNMALPQPGVCGAAIVEDDSDEGGVAGFFSEGNSDFALTPCLNELIDRGWALV